ncbi:S-adenosylmethionine:tRNA ribosyltransferase-isomerase [Kitasatospora aureofaciens]|uniref:Queuosine biosynthesis protein n=1 Tax=Kitasatospora aureofaciens TaxID=1894 RepID=A0A1E7MX78_KITAU|nr:S-adenosylmethionine:tRNA ribosyltransferase-isomerase [Kitasatospora aureofaciens]ARF81437.1 queuosine biosynthesis protein [Kitasatospora aureofaciens]OEV33021.1 queuosine biosynthesis protein [Kitasatospora aureofaciens]GGU55381.1 S-adenosylmethionine:tRNA ribosyltransferase-isomerase [Kitasatospora aureofaciens]
MTTLTELDLHVTVPPELSARAPAEARGGARDGVRMLVGRRATGAVEHRRFTELPEALRPGDLLVVNNSGTLPAALPGRLPDGTPVALHLSSAQPDQRGSHLVELRRPVPGSAASYYPPQESPARPGLHVALPAGGAAELVQPFTDRLWYAELSLPATLLPYLRLHGRAIRYGYVDRDWPIEAYQTVFASVPGSSEMPSAARPFTPTVVARLAGRGVLVAPVTLHTGVASPEAHEAPYAERFRVPATTARLVGHVRAGGGRVIAVGTTVVRALESAVGPDGTLQEADGWTELVITPERGVRGVDGLLTGWHEPRASHLLMLAAVAGRPLLTACYREAVRQRYLWHEFGDVNLLLPD